MLLHQYQLSCRGDAVDETILFGQGKQMRRIPREAWEGHLAEAPQHAKARLAFMLEAHHQVRYFVVRELPVRGIPLEPGDISQALGLPLVQVDSILDELERELFFLVRDTRGAVGWAYPVTVEPTPHRLSFSTGERLFGA
jgi:hypothetical protein